MAVATLIYRPKSVRNSCEIECLVAFLCCQFAFLNFQLEFSSGIGLL